jgi:hypothetical protein
MADGVITTLGKNLIACTELNSTIATQVSAALDNIAALSDYLLQTYPNDTNWQVLKDAVTDNLNALSDSGVLPPAPPPHN